MLKIIIKILSSFVLPLYFTDPILVVNENECIKDFTVNEDAKTVLYQEEQEQNQSMQYELIISEIQKEMDELKAIEDKMEWFISYKQLVQKYENIIDPPLTIYDYYTKEEIYLIQRVVETECYDQEFISKVNIACVIFNRVEDINGQFGNNVTEVITKENQFTYWRKDITESTILAVEYAASIEDTTDGCIAFRSGEKPDEWYGWEYAFIDDAGHHFYREKEEY